jgi:hypothetical protein
LSDVGDGCDFGRRQEKLRPFRIANGTCSIKRTLAMIRYVNKTTSAGTARRVRCHRPYRLLVLVLATSRDGRISGLIQDRQLVCSFQPCSERLVINPGEEFLMQDFD